MSDPKETWSVWLANVDFEDGTGTKSRPVIVLKDDIVLCIVLETTTKEKSKRYGYMIKNIKSANLNMESWVKFGQRELTPDKFVRRIGMLDEEDVVGIRGWLNSYLLSP